MFKTVPGTYYGFPVFVFNSVNGEFSDCSLPTVVRYLNAYTGVVLLRCRKEFYQLLWSALPFITHLESKGHRYSCFLNTLHVGGKSGGSLCTVAVFIRNSSELSRNSGRVSCCPTENKMSFHCPCPQKTATVSQKLFMCQVQLEPVRNS